MMILSMTGFGKASQQLPTKKITVEIKSLNSKGLDLNVRMPQNFRELELGLRTHLGQVLERGKIDVSVFLEMTSEETTAKINEPIIKNYMQQMKAILPLSDETELLKMAIRLPDALKTERDELDPNEWIDIQKTIDVALANLQNFRKDEGKSLENEFKLRLQNIHELLIASEDFESERIETVKNKIRTALEDLKLNIDENRFEQELIYYLEKYDVTEEKVRLANHLKYFQETIDSPEANGRKLGFITQEIGREINTLGSKANHAGMQKLVVQMKDELEKMKEQVLNIL